MLSTHQPLNPLFLLLLRGSSGVSVSGPCYDADGHRGPHVHPHLLWLCGLPARKHLPSADCKSGVFQPGQALMHSMKVIFGGRRLVYKPIV